jgi:deoxyhypusine synthase
MGRLKAAALWKGISWGKINAQEGTRAVCYCDAPFAMPLITHALSERVTKKRKGPDMSWIFEGVKNKS